METGSSLFMFLLLGVMMLVLIVLPARRAKKAQEQLIERQESMVPGTKVMTNFGLYGTVSSLDRDQNVAYLEIAPGAVVKVHLMTVTTIEDSTKPVDNSSDANTPTIEGRVADDPAN